MNDSQAKNDAVKKRVVNAKLVYASRLKKLSNAIHAADDINSILVGLKDQIISLYGAEYVTIYLVDNKKKEIYSRVMDEKDSLKEVRLPISSKSIAGHVALSRKDINIKNVYDREELLGIDPDLRFDSSWDKKSGIMTRQILAVPIVFKNTLNGVIQLMNKKNGKPFSAFDQKLLSDISEVLGIAFHNQARFKKIPSRYDHLIKEGLMSEKEFTQARDLARKQGKPVENVLLMTFGITKGSLREALSQYYKIPAEDVLDTQYKPEDLIKEKNLNYFLKSYWLPLEKVKDTITVAIDNPSDFGKIQEIKQMYNVSIVKLRLSLKTDIEQYIKTFKSTPSFVEGETIVQSLDEILSNMKVQDDDFLSEGEEIDEIDNFNDNSVVLLVRKIIEDAFDAGSSDIHIEPYGVARDAEVRFRIDGRCHEVLTIPRNFIKGVVSRIKILAKLDIAERRKPQDGKIKFKTSKGKEIELRVATVPTANSNEDVVMRILAGSEPLPLNKIMPEQTFDRFKEVIVKPYGIVLVVGPTGSGKTTTLHSALGYINKPDRKIWTAEDPVEITQYRLRQVQVNAKIGYTFAAAMRAFLRADPDVIMVGEMRDKETMGMGIEASLTGHLVFSTLHTNSAPETITRLNDMGLDPFNFADALLGILAQRLVKTFCGKCKQEYRPEKSEYKHLKEMYGDMFDERVSKPYSKDLMLYKAGGCEACGNTGYKGRMGLYEFLAGTDGIQKKIIERALVEDIRKTAIEDGMSTLLQDGIACVFNGHTDIHQVMSVCSK